MCFSGSSSLPHTSREEHFLVEVVRGNGAKQKIFAAGELLCQSDNAGSDLHPIRQESRGA